MPAKVKPIPDGYRTATPYLIIQGAAAALDFYKKGLRRDRAREHGTARRQDRPR